MRSVERLAAVAISVVAMVLFAACVERATDADLDRMCARLVELRPSADATEVVTKCKQDAARERTKKRIADCRAEASDLDTFWNKCR